MSGLVVNLSSSVINVLQLVVYRTIYREVKVSTEHT